MSSPRQLIQVGDQQIALPEGVTVSEWGLEKVTVQNPRIRAFLGCVKLLGSVLESNYAILHCSPERLQEIWRKVRKVAELIRTKIAPLLRVPSRIPDLEEARQRAHDAYSFLDQGVLEQLSEFPESVAPHRLMELRKLLCVSIGQLHSFLQDTFSDLAASDPRSGPHDADYFISRRFSEDIDEAEWLYATVSRLSRHLERMMKVLPVDLGTLAQQVRREKTIPHHHMWENVQSFLDLLTGSLVPKLREVLSLRGIRFSEMEVVDRYAHDLPVRCRMLVEVHDLGGETIEEIQGNVGSSHVELEQCGLDLKTCHAVVSRRMADHMREIDRILRDLIAFIPLWLQGISRRRALMLRKIEDLDDETLDDGQAAPDEAAPDEAAPDEAALDEAESESA